MGRKKIGLFMNEITQFFQESCGKALVNAARERDMDLIIYATYGSYSSPYGRNFLTEIGKKNIIHLPDYSSFDAIIVLPNTFDIPGMDVEFFSLVKQHATCPVICLQNDFSEKYPDFYSITVENKLTMYAMTKHLIKEHHLTDICYMSGPFTSKDSPERLEGFRLAMQDAGLSVGEYTVYEGNYWINRGERAMNHFMTDRDTYPQAIICANDYMALSICDELKKHGKKVPEDVVVTGFDNIREGQENDPALTTVQINPESYAEAAMNLIDDLFAGKKRDHVVMFSGEIVLRDSCGCHFDHTHHYSDYKDALRQLIDKDSLLREAGRLTADYQTRYDLENTLSVADYYFHTLGCSKGYLCLCSSEEPGALAVEQNQIFSDEITLMQIMYEKEREHPDIINKKFDRRDILPSEYFDTEHPETLIIYPLYFKNKEYGYLVMNPLPGEWPNSLTNTYTNTLATAFENVYYQNRFEEFAKIKKLSETDPLTGLNNRRGFEKGLSKILSVHEKGEEHKTVISIASIDMDNLKEINDEFGHSEGDFALNTLARTLKSCIRADEVCARFGGDEFSAILLAGDKDRILAFTEQFTDLLQKASDTSGKPYPIHASIGICELKGHDTKDIFECMQKADETMYMNKRNYKGIAL